MQSIDLPIDAKEHVLDFQLKMRKEKHGVQFNQQQAIIGIIREHRQLIQEIEELKKSIAELQKRLRHQDGEEEI
jgi:hypothetical protein